MLSGALALLSEQHDADECRNAYGKCQHRGIAKMERGDAYEQARAVRDEPDKPHADAQLVEAPTTLLTAANSHKRCPQGMEKHEDNGQQAGNGVQRRGCGGRGARDGGHDGGSGRVADQAQPEQRQMALLKRAGATLAKNANGIKDKSERDRCRRRHNQRIHRYVIPPKSISRRAHWLPRLRILLWNRRT